MQLYAEFYTLQKPSLGKKYFQQTNGNQYQIWQKRLPQKAMISTQSASIPQHFENMPLTSSLMIFCWINPPAKQVAADLALVTLLSADPTPYLRGSGTHLVLGGC